MTAIQEAASEAVRAGLSLIPPAEDGSKRPAPHWPPNGPHQSVGVWTPYMHQCAPEPQLRAWWGPRLGMGTACGKVSGNLECLEFDDRDTYEAFKSLAQQADLSDLLAKLETGYVEDSPAGGVHWLYRCRVIAGNLKLASRPGANGTPEVLIETRGEGGYVILAPSSGPVHQTGKPYIKRAGSFATIPRLTPTERDDLHHLAQTFNEVLDPAPAPPRTAPTVDRRPGDDFNQRATWSEVLDPYGWTPVFTRGDETHWRRPGKDSGMSATSNHRGTDTLKVFSTSTPFPTQGTLSKFSAYALLNFSGDHSSAARALAAQGYGAPARLQSAPPPLPPVSIAPDSPAPPGGLDTLPPFPLTELGAAEAFAAAYADRIRWDFRRGRWLIFTQHRWAPDPSNDVIRFAIDHVRHMQQIALTLEDAVVRQRVMTHWLKFDRKVGVDNIVTLAKSILPLADAGDTWDRDPWLLGCANGLVDLRTGELRDGTPADRVTASTGHPFDPQTPCPRWQQFIREVLPDPDVATFVWRALGYSLTSDMREQCFFLLYGRGRNGKSTLLDIVGRVLGDYAHVAAFSTFEQAQPGAPSYDLASLDGMRLVSAAEGSGKWLHSSRLKDVTGGEKVNARHPYGRPFEFRPACKIWLSTNELPRVADESEGMWRRIRQIPFTQRFEGTTDNLTLKDELLLEAPGILAWLVAGCLHWQSHGLTTPGAVSEATATYRADSDPLGCFIDETCELTENSEVQTSDLYKHYLTWAHAHSMNARETLSATSFGRKCADKFIRVKRNYGNVYLGIARKWVEG
ncbi:MAG: phage/plasmid primase, P4 family [Planctomycetota bacterium]